MKTLKYTLLAFVMLFSLNITFAQADVDIEVQEQTNWCWAANTRCIFDYYNVKPGKQCDIVEWAYNNRKRCCGGNGRSCNEMNVMKNGDGRTQAMPYQGILEICTDYGGLDAVHYSRNLSTSRLEKANAEKRPFIVGCIWAGGRRGGHVVVGYAYERGYVSVMDPWRNNGKYTFKSGYHMSLNGQSGTWEAGVEITQKLLSVDEAFKKDIKLYPTAVTTNLNIELANNSGAKTVDIYNVLGKKVATEELNGAKTYLNLSSIAGGIYFAKINDGANKEATFKFIKK